MCLAAMSNANICLQPLSTPAQARLPFVPTLSNVKFLNKALAHADLVACILASQPTLDAVLMPRRVCPSPPKPAAKPPSAAMPELAPMTAPAPAAVPLDPEPEKRKACAACFAIPVVKPKPARLASYVPLSPSYCLLLTRR